MHASFYKRFRLHSDADRWDGSHGPRTAYSQRRLDTGKDVARIQTGQQESVQQNQPAEESVKPENVKSEKAAEPATRNDPLLAEQTVSNKEQRQADWAIIKKYGSISMAKR